MVYTGQFHGGLRHGNGSITTPSGFTFSGTFVEDSACGGGTGVVVAVDAWSPPEETVDPKKKKAAKPKKGDEEPPADPLGTIAVKAGLIVPALTLRVTSDPHDESAHPVVHGVTWLSPTPAADDVTVKIAAAESGRVLSAQLFSVALGERVCFPFMTVLFQCDVHVTPQTQWMALTHQSRPSRRLCFG